jgi:hypothetical protein
LSLRGRPGPSRLVQAFAGDDRQIVDYLVDEPPAMVTEDARMCLVLGWISRHLGRLGEVLVQQLRDGGATLGCLGADAAGLEVLPPPGERVGAGVHDRPERPTRQLLYVTSPHLPDDGIVGMEADIIPDFIPRRGSCTTGTLA